MRSVLNGRATTILRGRDFSLAMAGGVTWDMQRKFGRELPEVAGIRSFVDGSRYSKVLGRRGAGTPGRAVGSAPQCSDVENECDGPPHFGRGPLCEGARIVGKAPNPPGFLFWAGRLDEKSRPL